MLLGNKIKELRDKHEVLQRQLAAYLEIDTPMFSKIERGDRRAKRSQVILLAKYFHIDEKEMLTLWLADKVLDALEGEEESSIRCHAFLWARTGRRGKCFGICIIHTRLFVSSVTNSSILSPSDDR